MDKNIQVVVPILGMHRSGTSMLTRMLNIMGVELGQPLQPPSFDNPKGFWENRYFQTLNMNVLRYAGCNENGFAGAQTLKETCGALQQLPFLESEMDLIAQYINDNFTDTHWGWKDPRTIITWPFWKCCLQYLQYEDVRPVVIVRHPDSCVESLNKRGDFADVSFPREIMPDDYVNEIWKAYYELIELNFSGEALILLQEQLLIPDKAYTEMMRCAEYLGLPEAWISPALATIDVELVSSIKRDSESPKNALAKTVYERFRNRAAQQQRAFSQKVCMRSDAAIHKKKLIPSRYCIYIVTLDGFVHSRAFDDHALSLHYAFRDLGYIVPVVRHPWEIVGTPIVLGAQLLQHVKESTLPSDSIIYNLEQIFDGSSWLTDEYMDLLQHHQVWDYSSRNIEALKDSGVRRIRRCQIGYVPELSGIPQLPEEEQDIDVLFYGVMNERRQAILNRLKSKGLHVGAHDCVYGRRRDCLIARAKIVLNIHYYESKVMEIVRLAYLLANKKCIVSENGNDSALEKPFEDGIVFTNYDALVKACMTYVEDPVERKRVARKGYEIFGAQKQTDFLRNALSLDS